MKTNKGFAPLALILILVAVLAVGGIAYYAGKKSDTATQQNTQANNPPAPVSQNKNNTPNNSTARIINSTQSQPIGCTTTTQPYIKVLTPKSGAMLTSGHNFLITWTSCNVQKVLIGMAQGGHDLGYFTSTPIPATPGSYQWMIPTPHWLSNTGFFFSVWDADAGHQDILGKSGTFSIQ